MVHIITGAYGSGKTEVSINLALSLAKRGTKTALIDLDIVNPYFRTKDAAAKLDAFGVNVIAPEYANTNVDLPVVPAEVASAFSGVYDATVFDVGGDDRGAIALGRYKRHFEQSGYIMYLCVNPFRPGGCDAAETAALVDDIQQASRLRVTQLISNPNLKHATQPSDVVRGCQAVRELAEKLRLPVAFTAVKQEYLTTVAPPALPLDLHLLLPWEV